MQKQMTHPNNSHPSYTPANFANKHQYRRDKETGFRSSAGVEFKDKTKIFETTVQPSPSSN